QESVTIRSPARQGREQSRRAHVSALRQMQSALSSLLLLTWLLFYAHAPAAQNNTHFDAGSTRRCNFSISSSKSPNWHTARGLRWMSIRWADRLSATTARRVRDRDPERRVGGRNLVFFFFLWLGSLCS